MNLTFWFHNSARRSDPIPWRSETILSFRPRISLRDILVRAKHRRPPPKTPGAFRCNRSRCKTPPFITEGTQGWIQDFFRMGCTRLLLYFNTDKPHSCCCCCFFFCRIPVVLENSRSSQGGGVRTPSTLPLDPPPEPRLTPSTQPTKTAHPTPHFLFIFQSHLHDPVQ